MAFERKLQYVSGNVPVLGAIFMSNRATKEMCFSWQTFGLPYNMSSFVKQVKAGMFLFLFEHETRKLYGVYQASSDGTMNLNSAAFSSAGKQYPAQVTFNVIWYCKPLSEDEFRPAIKDNYFTEYKFKFGLSKKQVRELLKLFYSRKHDDALQIPNDSCLIRGATSSPIMDDAGERFDDAVQNKNLLENANSPKQNRELEKFSLPIREVIKDDIDHANAVVDTALPSCRRDFSSQGRVIQVRDMMDYGCKPKKDHMLDSGVPYMPKDEGYDPDAPLLNDITAIQHLERCREEWNEGVYTTNAVDGSPHFKVSEGESSAHQIHSSSGMQYACDVANVDEFSDVCERRQLVPPTKRSVFSRLKPAMDADEGCKVEDTESGINDMVNKVMKTLNGHYCQLVSGSNLAMDASDDDDNKIKFKRSQTLQSRAAKYEPPVDLAGAYEGQTVGQIIWESPSRVTFKRRSEVRKTFSAAQGEISSAALEEKQCKRRKLVRPSSGEMKSNKDDKVDKVSENPLEDGSVKTDAPLPPRNEGQNPLEAGSLGSLILATSVPDSGESRSSNLTDGIADISTGFESEKNQIQPFSNPCASDAQHLAKQCNISLGGKSSESAFKREDSEGAELSLALGSMGQKDGHAMLDNANVGSPPKSVVDHVKKEMSNDSEESINCTLQLNLMIFGGDKKPGNTVCCDMDGEVESGDIGVLGVSTAMELGRQHDVYADQMPDNESGKLVELDGGQKELMGRDNVHEEAMSNNLLAEGISASCQENEVCYFEFLTK